MAQYVEGSQQTSPRRTAIIPIGECKFIVSERTAKLLFLSSEDSGGEDLSEVWFGKRILINIDEIGGKIETSELPAQEPSTIFVTMPIIRPPIPEEIPRPDYYPTYAELTPEQKWIYINWLQDTSAPINIGYIFLYYYVLERHLLWGEFDLAFDEILFLRKHHRHSSFLSYSGSALIHSSVFRRRHDRLEELNRSGELFSVGNEELFIAHHLGLDLT